MLYQCPLVSHPAVMQAQMSGMSRWQGGLILFSLMQKGMQQCSA